MRGAAAGHVLGDALPLTQRARHHPVDHVVHLRLDPLRRIGHDVTLELALDPRLVQQVGQPSHAQRVVEEPDTAILELLEHVVDLGEAELELPREVGTVDVELTVDVVHGGQIVAQNGHPSVDRLPRRLRQAQADPERIEELQPQAFLLVERRADVAFELVEAIVRHRLANGLPQLLPERATRRHGEDRRLGAEQCARVLGDEAPDLLALIRRVRGDRSC